MNIFTNNVYLKTDEYIQYSNIRIGMYWSEIYKKKGLTSYSIQDERS